MDRAEADYTRYLLCDEGGICILILYVDNILIMGANTTQILRLKHKLMTTFKMTDLGRI
jgi:hypothetical protein